MTEQLVVMIFGPGLMSVLLVTGLTIKFVVEGRKDEGE